MNDEILKFFDLTADEIVKQKIILKQECVIVEKVLRKMWRENRKFYKTYRKEDHCSVKDYVIELN